MDCIPWLGLFVITGFYTPVAVFYGVSAAQAAWAASLRLRRAIRRRKARLLGELPCPPTQRSSSTRKATSHVDHIKVCIGAQAFSISASIDALTRNELIVAPAPPSCLR